MIRGTSRDRQDQGKMAVATHQARPPLRASLSDESAQKIACAFEAQSRNRVGVNVDHAHTNPRLVLSIESNARRERVVDLAVAEGDVTRRDNADRSGAYGVAGMRSVVSASVRVCSRSENLSFEGDQRIVRPCANPEGASSPRILTCTNGSISIARGRPYPAHQESTAPSQDPSCAERRARPR